jgi:hypothetical protein
MGRVPILSSPDYPPSPGEFPGGAVCGAIGVEFLIRNGTVGPQGPLPIFRQERSLQYLVAEVCGVLIKDLPLGKRLVRDGQEKVAAGPWGIEHII